MFCETCSEQNEVIDIVRSQKRVLRHVVRRLRDQVKSLCEDADAKFLMICDTETNAEAAMRELWESGEFSCGPQDYVEIVKQATNAMYAWRSVKLEHTAPAHCTIPPEGWRCTREPGHSGPCAAIHV